MLRCELQEISLTFRNVGRHVASCDMSITACNAILRKLGNQSLSFAHKRFQVGGERTGALQVAKKYCDRVIPPLQLAMFFSRHRCETSCKKNGLVQHGLEVSISQPRIATKSSLWASGRFLLCSFQTSYRIP